jgi:hypothetical protein
VDETAFFTLPSIPSHQGRGCNYLKTEQILGCMTFVKLLSPSLTYVPVSALKGRETCVPPYSRGRLGGGWGIRWSAAGVQRPPRLHRNGGPHLRR